MAIDLHRGLLIIKVQFNTYMASLRIATGTPFDDWIRKKISLQILTVEYHHLLLEFKYYKVAHVPKKWRPCNHLNTT